MAISVDSIRNFSDGGRMLLDGNGGVGAAGPLQRLMVFFGLGGARARNTDTLGAIRAALAGDPRFFAADVQAEAARLLSKVRTDRAVGAAEIKAIVARLDGMSTGGKRLQAARDIVAGRIALRGIPDFLSECGRAGYVRLAGEEIVNGKEPACGYGKIDYDAALDGFEARMRAIFARLGDGPGDREVLSGMCGKGLRSKVGGLKTRDLADTFVDGLRANLDESRALGLKYGERTRLAVVAMLKDMGKPVMPTGAAPMPVAAMVEAARSLPKTAFANLGANPSAAEADAAMAGLAHALDRADFGFRLPDAADMRAAKSLMLHSFAESLDGAAKAGFLAALESDAGRDVLLRYDARGLLPHGRSQRLQAATA